jgi:class 3 adenylate cyclase
MHGPKSRDRMACHGHDELFAGFGTFEHCANVVAEVVLWDCRHGKQASRSAYRCLCGLHLGILVSQYRRKGHLVTRKNMTLRLPAEQAAELEAVARAEGISVSDAVREAIAEHIERKRKDKGFRERLHAAMERDREILERLAR